MHVYLSWYIFIIYLSWYILEILWMLVQQRDKTFVEQPGQKQRVLFGPSPARYLTVAITQPGSAEHHAESGALLTLSQYHAN